MMILIMKEKNDNIVKDGTNLDEELNDRNTVDNKPLCSPSERENDSINDSEDSNDNNDDGGDK